MRAITKGRTGLAPGMRKVTEWVGKRVVTVNPLRNGWGEAAAGTLATVTYARAGLTLQTDACKCCGLAMRMTRIPASDVRLADVDEEVPADNRFVPGRLAD